MKLKFLKAKYKGNLNIAKDFEEKLISTFKKNSNIAIYSAVQFRDFFEEVQNTLNKNNFKYFTSKAFRTSIEGQILGCDSYADSLNLKDNNLESDDFGGFIYIGDGYFHPNALLLLQENFKEIKPVLILNVVQNICEIIDKNHIESYIKKKKANLAKFYMSDIIGVFVSSKWGQEYKNSALKLKEKYPKKKFYFFVADNFLESEVENFPFIECWVNTACPRIGQDDIVRQNFPMINIKDIFN